MRNSDIGVYLHKSKTEAFVKKKIRSTEEELFYSEKYFLNRIVKKGQKILDVGCATGGLYNILKKKVGYLDYTGLEIDPLCVKAAKKMYPEATFIAGNFLDNKFEDDTFDIVISMLVMSMQPNYKKFISELVRVCRGYILFDTRLKYEGSTVIDKDISYFYYHGSGKRNYYIVFNVFELLNFLHIETLHIKKISLIGYYPKDRTSAFLPTPKDRLLIGMFCLKKYPKLERNFIRHGGYREDADRPWCELDIKLPNFKKRWF